MLDKETIIKEIKDKTNVLLDGETYLAYGDSENMDILFDLAYQFVARCHHISKNNFLIYLDEYVVVDEDESQKFLTILFEATTTVFQNHLKSVKPIQCPTCPNQSNSYHVCTQYCVDQYSHAETPTKLDQLGKHSEDLFSTRLDRYYGNVGILFY